MEWKSITLPTASTTPRQTTVSSWQGAGSRGDYLLVALTNRDVADAEGAPGSDAPGPDAVIGYLLSRGVFTLPERAILASEEGAPAWISEDEYQVSESELLTTAKAFCEFFDVEGAFPSSSTWESHAALYRDVVAGKATPPAPKATGESDAGVLPSNLESAPSMFAVFDEPTLETETEPESAATSTYYPATPFTLVTDARADEETGHEFVLHFDPELERYSVFFFAEERHAKQVQDEYNEFSTTKWAVVVRFDPRGIDERFGVRYADRDGRVTDMSIEDYRRNMEMRSEFRRDD